MAKSNCFSFTASRNWFLKYSFSNSGLKSSTTDLGNGTIIHCWIPKTHKEKKPSLVLIHGIGANAMWQWSEFIKPLSSRFNLYIPDLLFFGESYTVIKLFFYLVKSVFGWYGIRRNFEDCIYDIH